MTAAPDGGKLEERREVGAMEPVKEWAPHRRATTDPEFLRRVTAAYRGRLPVLNALWWVEHPSLPAPDGHPSPEARSRELQRVVFSRQDGGEHPLESEELAMLEHELVEERRAIREAIMAAWADVDTDAESEGADADNPRDTPGPPSPTSSSVRGSGLLMTSRTSRTLAVVGILLFGLAAGYGSGVLSAAAPQPEVRYIDSTTGDGIQGFEQPAVAALAIFDRPQRFGDRLVVAGVGESFPALPSTTIQLPTVRFLASVGPRKIFTAKDSSAHVCLLAVSVDGEEISATCVEERSFPSRGVRLSFAGTPVRVSDSITPTDPDASRANRAFYAVRWTVDGSIESTFESLNGTSVG